MILFFPVVSVFSFFLFGEAIFLLVRECVEQPNKTPRCVPLRRRCSAEADRVSSWWSEDVLELDGIVDFSCGTHLLQDVRFLFASFLLVFVRPRSTDQTEPRDARMTPF